MAVSKKVANETLRKQYIDKVFNFFKDNGEETMYCSSNIVAFPVVNQNNDDEWIKITVTVPTGANKGTEPFDGYAMAEEYKIKQEEKERKRKENELKKEKKRKKEEEKKKKKEEIFNKSIDNPLNL